MRLFHVSLQYVDLEYEGNGIAEYMFWDRETGSWDDRACKYGGGGSGDQNNNNGGEARCAKMDCHLEDTHFSLLGFFKHKVIDDWMEQLFKHEGYCIWSDEEYAFMSNARKGWPQGCSVSSTYINGNEERPIYYDIKPKSGGRITIGLYTDPQCVKEYKQGINDSITPENVLGNFLLQEGSGSGDNGNYDFSGYSYSDSMAMWENSFDIFKICHPCVAYDLQNYGYNADDDNNRGQNYGKYTYGYDDDYSYQYYQGDNQGDDFDCYDDADYTNVNQVSRVSRYRIARLCSCVAKMTHLTVILFFFSPRSFYLLLFLVHEIYGQDYNEHGYISGLVARQLAGKLGR